MTDKQETLEEMDQRFHDGGVSWDDLVKWYWLLKADFEQAEAERDLCRAALKAMTQMMGTICYERMADRILARHGLDPSDFEGES